MTITTLDSAMSIALKAHHGQSNAHNGEPYILHVHRVACAVRDAGHDELHQAVAWLHDVVEDTDITLDYLASIFWNEADLVTAVSALTKKKGQSNEDYYNLLKLVPIAARVKVRDMQDNFRRNHLIEDDEKRLRMAHKYSLGMDMLKEFL
jgi:(p)ppGpp synthase/HD superfamily hydrolase